MVESTALEMRRACEGTVGSNPTLSATVLTKPWLLYVFFVLVRFGPIFGPTNALRSAIADCAVIRETAEQERRTGAWARAATQPRLPAHLGWTTSVAWKELGGRA